MSIAEESSKNADDLTPTRSEAILPERQVPAEIDDRAELVLRLRFVDGLTEQAIADRVGSPVGEVSILIRRRVAALMKELSGMGTASARRP